MSRSINMQKLGDVQTNNMWARDKDMNQKLGCNHKHFAYNQKAAH